jgi:hypothetical protein
VWLILVLLLPSIGAIAWLLLGRPERAGWRPSASDYSRSGPLGLEDLPTYNSRPEITDRQSAELDRKLLAWEREQAERRRELELREREIPASDDDIDNSG